MGSASPAPAPLEEEPTPILLEWVADACGDRSAEVDVDWGCLDSD